MQHTYITVKGRGSSELHIERSRFITYLDRAESEQEALQLIEYTKREHPEATHHCYAYIIGPNGNQQKANDDGEPSGTAGRPILEVLKKNGLSATVAVVVRYFGGIKLGAGGLIRAYGQATIEGLEAVGIVRRRLHRTLKVTIDYPLLGQVETSIRLRGRHIIDTTYLEQVTITLLTPLGQEEEDEEWLTNLTNGAARIAWGDYDYLEEPVT